MTETKSSLEQIVKAYDIRGIYPDEINAEVCSALGAGFGAFIRKMEPETTEVVIGRDMRASGPELVAGFAKGVMSCGLNVIDAGLCSTDMMYFASGSQNIPGAVFTASHNPAEYNGIKLCRSAAAPIGQNSGLDEISAVASRTIVSDLVATGSKTSRSFLDDFANHVRSFIDARGLKPLKVVADTANGMGGLVVPEVFKQLPFDLEIMFAELDGTFPNHEANPLEPKNLVDLQARVLETGADIGLAFDGDADRVFLVDEKAQAVSGSLTTALLAKSILVDNPDSVVIYNLICSKVVPEVIAESGGKPLRSRVGHSFIKELMAETDAVFGGEHSAHYYFRDNWRADSGLIAAVMVLEQLSRFDGTLSEMLEPLKRYEASGEINSKVEDTSQVIAHVRGQYVDAECDDLDGLTVDCGSWWFNLRASNTEPLLRLNLEAENETEVAKRISEVKKVMAEA